MSISVPSMVAEDVLDGTDTPIITTDPEVHGRIDAVSEAVDLMDTRINAVSNMSELLYANCVSADEALSDRIDAVSKVASLGDAILTKDQLQWNGLGNAANAYQSSRKGLTNSNSQQVYDVMTVKDSKTKAVYPIAALGFVCPATNNTGIYWQKSGQTYDLQFTRNGGKSWTSLTGTTGSTSGNYLPVVGPVDSLCLYPTSDNVDTYSENVLCSARVFKFGPNDTNIVYGLQTSLAAIGIHSTPGKEIIDAGAVQMALVQGATGASEPHFVWWNDDATCRKWEPWKSSGNEARILSGFSGPDASYNQTTGLNYQLGLGLDYDTKQAYLIVKNGANANWQPLEFGADNSTGSSSSSGSTTQTEVITLNSNLSKLEFSYQDGFLYPSTQRPSESWLTYCSGITCNYFRDPDGDPWIHHAEMRFTKNTSTDEVEIQLRRDITHDWITVASTAGATSSGSGSVMGDLNGPVTTLASITNSMHGVQFNSRDQVFINAHDGNLVRSESNRLVSKQYTSDRIHNSTYPYLELHGSSTLRWFDGDDVSEIELASLAGGGSSGQKTVKYSGDSSLMLELVGSTTYRVSPYEGSDCIYAVQMFLAAAGIHNTPDKDKHTAARTVMALVEGATQSSTPSIMWNSGDGHGYRTWEPWKEDGSSSSGSVAGIYELVVLDNGTDVGSRMAPLVSEKRASDGTYLDVLNWSIGDSASNAQETSGMYTLIGNPIALYDSAYKAPNDSRIKGAVRVVDMHGTICWQRYSYTNKQWEIEPTGSSDSDSSSVPIVNALATADYGTPVSYLTIENIGDAYSMYGMNDYADDSAFKRKSWEPSTLQTIEIGGNNGYDEFSGIVALRNYLAVPIKNPVGGSIQQQAPANTEHIIMGVHGMGVLKFSSGVDYNSYQTFKIDLSPFMPSLHGSTEPITSKMRWLLSNTEKLAALLDS
jgi:hypothetical protein